MHKINICLDSKIWIRNVPKIENKIRQILKKSIMTEKLFFKKKIEITVLLTRSKEMRFLNYKYRKINKDTDVLSFPCETPIFFEKKIIHKNIYLGDIALSFDYIAKQNQNFNDYLKKILIHGFLHLIGHNHESNKSFLRMERAQSKIINLL
ncbi:MAG: rRNA maturation RNase YbeY [alpha proteobacterium HIMB114]|nr:MAG: rRNA maturation RNase YbeY [alpha proteobacterium HIMB114]